MVEARGPVFAAGFQHVTKNNYTMLFLPDVANDELQRAGKAPVYWWLPNNVRIAQKENGDYKFRFLHFVGVRGSATHVGVAGSEEVSGGLLGFSTTTAPPGDVLAQATDELLNRFRGNDDHYWGWRTPVTPMFRPVPIISNTTTMTNLNPGPDGTVPVVGGPGPAGGSRSAPPRITSGVMSGPPAQARSVSQRAASRAQLHGWYFNMQGQGPGSINPLAENAYSGLVGSIPAAIIWAGFHGGDSGFAVWQNMRLKVWSPAVHMLIEGNWDRVQDHFSAAAHFGGWFWSGDIKAQFNSMVADGTITAKVSVDTTIPGADKMQAELEKRKDLIFTKFMDQAQKTIFDPAPFNEKPAESSGGFLGLGGGFALKLRTDRSHLHLRYEETTEFAYAQEYPISGSLTGLHDVIAADPANEKKYFTTLYLGDWERKVKRTVKPVVNWPDPAKGWVGEPVAFLSCQVGYPNTEGVVQWDGHIFQATEGSDTIWSSSTEMKAAADVRNAPPGWTPDKTFLKRKIHFLEPPNEAENQFVRISVEREVVDLDPGELGTLGNDINTELRVDQAGVMAVGPIDLNVDLEDAKQAVEVTLQAEGRTLDGNPRNAATLKWRFDDQKTERFWMIFTGDPGYAPRFTYQVRVIVKGTIFAHGMEWTGPLNTVAKNGALTISVPTQEEAISTRALPRFGMAAPAVGAVDRPPAIGAGGPPGGRPPRDAGKPAASGVTFSGWSARPPAPADSRAPGSGGGEYADDPSEVAFESYSTTPPR